jgi:transcriptional regulator with XRE-family HTH domain
MSNSTDANIDQAVKARWLDLGLSPADLAEVLGATGADTSQRPNATSRISADRLKQVAQALGFSVEIVNGKPRTAGDKNAQAAASGSLQSLLELRLLRVFRELQDFSTKQLLIDLAEQIVKRRAARPGDAG